MTQRPMLESLGRLGSLVVVAAVFWHLLAIFAPPRQPPPPNTEGRDYASYHYAVKAAAEGGDPYDPAQLDALAQAEETRDSVHPYFYPPPFLLAVAWAVPLELGSGFTVWLLINELCLLVACLALVRWWRPLGAEVAPILAALVALMYAVAYGVELGQANVPVLALVLVGLAVERRWPVPAGALVGLACMLKMSPALLVAWWLLRRRWAAAAAAIVAAVVLSLLTLPLLGLDEQLRFYTEILPRFGSGDYNGLKIKIGMFGNHSIPNLLHQAFPSGENQLSAVARGIGAVITLSLLAGLGAAFRAPSNDPLHVAAQACAVLIAMLFVPVYTYEHHLIFALPAMVLGILAIERRLLAPGWLWPLAVAIAVLLFPLPYLRQLALKVITPANTLGYIGLQELKFLALCVVFAAMVQLGHTRGQVGVAPPPRAA